MRKIDVDDGWSLEELPLREESDLDDGWCLGEGTGVGPIPELHSPEPRPPERRSHIVRLSGRVVIYPRSAARERRLAAFWKAALEEDAR